MLYFFDNVKIYFEVELNTTFWNNTSIREEKDCSFLQ